MDLVMSNEARSQIPGIFQLDHPFWASRPQREYARDCVATIVAALQLRGEHPTLERVLASVQDQAASIQCPTNASCELRDKLQKLQQTEPSAYGKLTCEGVIFLKRIIRDGYMAIDCHY